MRALFLFLGLGVIVLLLLYPPTVASRPSYNGSTPGCGYGGCHTYQSGILSTATNGLVVTVTLTGVTSGANVAGELVDASGTVVAVNDGGPTNPYTLTAPAAGTYTVNAGYKFPSRVYDSARVTLTATGVNDLPRGDVPTEVEVKQNYPNPFNPSSTIEYVLPHSSLVRLEVFNQQGELVRTLVSHPQAAGVHSVRFDATGLASGVYFYRLTTDGASVSRKMLLLR